MNAGNGSRFPVEVPFATARDALDYLDKPFRLTCLRCGRKCRSLGSHLFKVHGWRAREYKEFYGLPLRRGLVASATRTLITSIANERMEAGIMHKVGPADRRKSRRVGRASRFRRLALRDRLQEHRK